MGRRQYVRAGARLFEKGSGPSGSSVAFQGPIGDGRGASALICALARWLAFSGWERRRKDAAGGWAGSAN